MCTERTNMNHSLRATGCSRLFEAGVPEKVIQQWTGHLSLQGRVRLILGLTYVRTKTIQNSLNDGLSTYNSQTIQVFELC